MSPSLSGWITIHFAHCTNKYYEETIVTPRTLAKKIAEHALSKKAREVTIMDLRKVTDMTDFFVVCSADSDVQVKAIADAIVEGMETSGVEAWHVEGLGERQWVLVDYVHVVAHVFHQSARKFYALEKLWGDAKIQVVKDVPTVVRKKPARPARRAVKKAK